MPHDNIFIVSFCPSSPGSAFFPLLEVLNITHRLTLISAISSVFILEYVSTGFMYVVCTMG